MVFTCCAAVRDRYHRGTAELAAVGSSKARWTAGRMSAAVSGSIASTTCLQPRCSATSRAAAVSSIFEPGKSGGENRDPAARGSRHRGGDRAEIYPARQEGANGHVRDHVPIHGLQHACPRFGNPVGVAAALDRRDARRPEPAFDRLRRSGPMRSRWPGGTDRTWRKIERGLSTWPKRKKLSTPCSSTSKAKSGLRARRGFPNRTPDRPAARSNSGA